MSRKFLDSAILSVHDLLKRSTELSYNTRANYESITKQAIKQLHKDGIQLSNIKHIKQKHIRHLLANWQGLKPAVIKNRLSAFRHILSRLGKQDLPSNDDLGVAKRSYKPERNRAIQKIDFTKITDPYTRFSLQLQQHFGLRREEAIKFKVCEADKGDYIDLKASWTKGGIPRKIPVITQDQKDLLAAIRRFVGNNSLIPQNKSYIKQRNIYDIQTRNSGITNCHGLRHAYAQNRYRILTGEFTKTDGWEAPINQGKFYTEMNKFERAADKKARMIIANELGHSRIAIVTQYCG